MGLDINGLGTNQANAHKAGQAQKVRSESANRATTTKESSKPTVSISAGAKALSQLEGDVGNSVNEARVAEIRTAIENGSYKPNPERIADGMLGTDDLF